MTRDDYISNEAVILKHEFLVGDMTEEELAADILIVGYIKDNTFYKLESDDTESNKLMAFYSNKCNQTWVDQLRLVDFHCDGFQSTTANTTGKPSMYICSDG